MNYLINEAFVYFWKELFKEKNIHIFQVGHTFLLGTRYSKPLDATFLESKNKKELLVMGCYGLGISRVLASALEVSSSEMELRWPVEIAPYTVCIIPPKVNKLNVSNIKIVF